MEGVAAEVCFRHLHAPNLLRLLPDALDLTLHAKSHAITSICLHNSACERHISLYPYVPMQETHCAAAKEEGREKANTPPRKSLTQKPQHK
jgi:hypothetical protein